MNAMPDGFAKGAIMGQERSKIKERGAMRTARGQF
jgi:hypothetical protein